MTTKIRNFKIIRSSNCVFSFRRMIFFYIPIERMHHQVKFVFILIIWPMSFTVLSWLKDHLGCGLVNVCVLTLLHTTHKQQEESFQVIGQMRRITSSVWLTHGPRPFRKSRHVLEPWVIGRSLAHHHSLSVASFVFIFGLLHSSPDDDIDLPPLFFFFVEEFWSVKEMNLHHHSHIIGQALIQYHLTIQPLLRNIRGLCST